MTTTLLRKALIEYLDNNTITAEEKQQITSTIQELDDIDRNTDNRADAVWNHELYLVHASAADNLMNIATYDIYGKLYATQHGTVPYDRYALDVRAVVGPVSTPMMQFGYDIVHDLYRDNELDGCHNPDGTFNHDWYKQHVYDTAGGCNPEAAEQFMQAVVDLVANKTGFDITVNADGHILKAYDNAQFITDLLTAVENYKNDID